MAEGTNETTEENNLPVVYRPVELVVHGVGETLQCEICVWNFMARVRKNNGKEMPEQSWGFLVRRLFHWAKRLVGIRCRRH